MDDAHVYPTPEAREWLPSAVEALPAGSQIVLAARREPALPLARLRAHRSIVELGVRDLALTRGETARVVSNLGLDLRPPELEALAQRTEGWAAVVTSPRCRTAGRATPSSSPVASAAMTDSWRITWATRYSTTWLPTTSTS